MSIELTPDERAALNRRIDCPVPWCEGRWLDHGGDGQPPESWWHDDGMGIDLGHDATLSRSQEGSGSVTWSFSMGRANLMSGVAPGEMALALRDIAQRIEDQTSSVGSS